METSTTCRVRKDLERILHRFASDSDILDTTFDLGETGRVAVSRNGGEIVSFHGQQGMMIIHRCPNNDITVVTSSGLGNVEGISRRNGLLQGLDELPREVTSLINTLESHPASN
jgi:hypothetical protein